MTKKITAYKAFNKDWTCLSHQYEVGKTYNHEGTVSLCRSGFHACLSPFDCWGYYDVNDSKFAVVEVTKPKKEKDKDSKIATAEITIKAELSLPEFIETGIDYLINLTKNKKQSNKNSAQIGSSGDYAKIGSSGYSAKIGSSGDSAKIGSSGYSAKIGSSGDYAKIGSSGDYAKIGSSGYSAKIGSSGDYAKIGSSGYSAKIGSSGDYAKIGSSGDSAKVTSEGKDAVIASAGRLTRIKAKKGTWVSLAEYVDGECVGFATGCIGKKGLKEDVWYIAKNGKLKEEQ